MKIKSFQGGFDKNLCYLIWCEKTKTAGLIDPSVEIQPIIEFIKSENLILSKLLITHTHHDHIAYLHDINNIYNNINVHCHYKAINTNFEFKGLSHNQIIAIGDEIIIAIYTPGHFIDSMCFWNKKRKCLFSKRWKIINENKWPQIFNIKNIWDLIPHTINNHNK